MSRNDLYMVVGRDSTSLDEEVYTTYATSRRNAAMQIEDMRREQDGTVFLVDYVFSPAQVREAKY